MRLPRLFAAAVLAATLAAPAAAQAPGTGRERPWFDTYSHIVFAFNKAVYDTLSDPPPPVGTEEEAGTDSPLWSGIGHMASNLINEPMSVLGAAMAGDGPALSQSLARFTVNSTVGLLGFHDVATEWGLPPTHLDLGLALCARGVGEGPYLVIPFIGPRTLRDGLVDVVLVNAILYGTAVSLLPPGTGLATFAAVEAVESVADIAATRQIDQRAKGLAYDDYDRMRDAYLAQRRQRCAALATQTWPSRVE